MFALLSHERVRHVIILDLLCDIIARLVARVQVTAQLRDLQMQEHVLLLNVFQFFFFCLQNENIAPIRGHGSTYQPNPDVAIEGFSALLNLSVQPG